MSRVGKAPFELPSGVELTNRDNVVVVKGPKGSLAQEIDPRVSLSIEDGVVSLVRDSDEREVRALHGLYRALIANMVIGVSTGYSKELQAVGVGYRGALKGNTLELQVGYSHPVAIEAPEGITFEVPEPTKFIISGIDK